MKHLRVGVLIVVAVAGIKLALAESALTQTVPTPPVLSGDAPAAAEMSLEQATKQVITNHYASRVLSAKTEEINGRKVHVIKTLTLDGRIQQQTIAADTGVLLDIDNN